MIRWLGWRGEGGGREVLGLALPFILSNSLWTLQITIDRVLLSQYSTGAAAAAMPAVLLFWTPFGLLQFTANYATTFVAQYVGAGRPHRVGPAVWQALYFALAGGVAFIGLTLLADPLTQLGRHDAEVRILEAKFFHCLCFSALPSLITAAANSFFAGRGDSWTVLLVNAVGLSVNALLDYAWIFGHWGFPAWGIEGAGWATVAGASASALTALILLFRACHRKTFATLAGWRFEGDLFRRLMRFGLPNGLQVMLEGLAFTVFMQLLGRIGKPELAASNTAWSINMFAVLPVLGVGQALEVLVGQRLGQDRPDLAERSTWNGFGAAWLYMAAVGLLYLVVPGVFLTLFGNDDADWPAAAALVPSMLRFVALYCLFDSMSLTFGFALRGAGDTRFVTLVSLVLAWPLMVLPTAVVLKMGWGVYWAWAFATAYVIAVAVTFLLRFLTGKWKSMRVIEAAPGLENEPAESEPGELASVQ